MWEKDRPEYSFSECAYSDDWERAAAADLAALRERLEGQANTCTPLLAADLRLAARCVGAWAKLEGAARGTNWLFHGDEYGVAMDAGWVEEGYSSALAAVEGAEVGK
jgi:hypothetical protein